MKWVICLIECALNAHNEQINYVAGCRRILVSSSSFPNTMAPHIKADEKAATQLFLVSFIFLLGKWRGFLWITLSLRIVIRIGRASASNKTTKNIFDKKGRFTHSSTINNIISHWMWCGEEKWLSFDGLLSTYISNNTLFVHTLTITHDFCLFGFGSFCWNKRQWLVENHVLLIWSFIFRQLYGFPSALKNYRRSSWMLWVVMIKCTRMSNRIQVEYFTNRQTYMMYNVVIERLTIHVSAVLAHAKTIS